MKVIFLDFDGVLNSIQDSIFYSRTKGDYGFKFSPLACSNIQWLLEQDPSIKIVISSTWRVLHSLEELRIILSFNGIDSLRVIDITPHQNYTLLEGQTRGSQIKSWLDKHPEVTHYVILDDDGDMLEDQRSTNFIKISRLNGFMFSDTIQAGKILNISNADNWWKNILL